MKLDALIGVDLLLVQISGILLKIPHTRDRVFRNSPPQILLGAFSLSYMTFSQLLKLTEDYGKLDMFIFREGVNVHVMVIIPCSQYAKLNPNSSPKSNQIFKSSIHQS